MAEAGATVLIVDDDPDIVEVVKMVLEADGFATASASNGAECLAKVQEVKPDLIILDVMMETTTDGFHTAYALRKDPATKDIPILMLTAIEEKTGFEFSPKDDEDFLPVEEFMSKPVDPKDLVAKVKELLDKAKGC